MSRHYVSNDYDNSGSSGGRGSRDRRDSHDPGDLRDPGAARGAREQLIIRDLRERRYPSGRTSYTDSKDPEERAEVRIARGPRQPRETRYPVYGKGPVDSRDDLDRDVVRPRDEMLLQDARDPRRLVPSQSIPDAHHEQRNSRAARYLQDPGQIREEMEHPRRASQSRERWDERYDQHQLGYRRAGQPSSRNSSLAQDQFGLDRPQGPTSFMDTRVQEYFLPAAGINRDVLGEHLGPETTYRPSVNREGVSGYIIRASRPPTKDMISSVMVGSREWANETRNRREAPVMAAQSYHTDPFGASEGPGTIPEGFPSPSLRDSEAHLIGRPPTVEYSPRRLFDSPERIERRGTRPGQDGRYYQSDEVLIPYSSRREGSSISQSSTYGSPGSGSRATQQSSRSSYSAAPSSVQSVSDDRRRIQEVAQYPPRRSSASQYSGSAQASSRPTASYVDSRTGERVTAEGRPVAQRRLVPDSVVQGDDDPPDWDEAPCFRGFASGPENESNVLADRSFRGHAKRDF